MRDAIMTGIALILATLALAMTIVFALAYARGEGWFDDPRENSLFMQSGSVDDGPADRD